MGREKRSGPQGSKQPAGSIKAEVIDATQPGSGSNSVGYRGGGGRGPEAVSLPASNTR